MSFWKNGRRGKKKRKYVEVKYESKASHRPTNFHGTLSNWVLTPNRRIVKMKFSGAIALDGGGSSENHIIYLNHVGDPLATEGAFKFTGYDQMLEFYRNFLCIQAFTKLRLMNATNEDMELVAAPWVSGQSSWLTPYTQFPRSKQTITGHSSTAGSFKMFNPIPVMTFKQNLHQDTGMKQNADEANDYAGIDGATPVKHWTIQLHAETVANNSNIDAKTYVDVQIWAHVLWFGRKGVNDNQ